MKRAWCIHGYDMYCVTSGKQLLTKQLLVKENQDCVVEISFMEEIFMV